MQPIRLIAMDMDGTLLTRVTPTSARIPAENAAMLRRCAEAGVHLALASGRMPDDAGFFAQEIGLSMHIIGLNGSVILDRPGGTPLRETHLPEDISRRILQILESYKTDVAVFGSWEVVVLKEHPLDWANIVLGSGFHRGHKRLLYRSGGRGLAQVLPCAGKIVAITDSDPEGLAAARAHIQREFPELSISSSWWNNFEINPKGVNKGTALEALAHTLNIPMSQVMAIGDNGNDVPMLRAAGIGAAMGNATAEAKEAADFVTLKNEECGVAAAIQQIIFGE